MLQYFGESEHVKAKDRRSMGSPDVYVCVCVCNEGTMYDGTHGHDLDFFLVSASQP